MARFAQWAGVATAASFRALPDPWIRSEMTVVGLRTAWELRGRSCLNLELVRPDRERKSVGAERTFSEDIAKPGAMLDQLRPIAERLQDADQQGRTVILKLKSHDHEVSTRQTTLDRPVDSKQDLMVLVRRLLKRPHPPEEPVHLLGISVSSLVDKTVEGHQLEFSFKN